jgi:hypothetical protein
MDITQELEPVHPFRWNIHEHSQLGNLLEAAVRPAEGEDDPFERGLSCVWSLGPDGKVAFALGSFMVELTRCCARAISLCDNSDLFFVGRSPESMFEFLSGALLETSWHERLNLLHFSTGYWRWEDDRNLLLESLPELKTYLSAMGLETRALARRERPIAFVDIVASGDTLITLANLLRVWCLEVRADWPAVRRKLRVVALTQKQKPRPRATRWTRVVDWEGLYERGAIENTPISSRLFHYLGGEQPKAAQSYHPYWWGNVCLTVPMRDPATLAGLRMAVTLFDAGLDKGWRRALAREMVAQPAMKHPWFRDLVLEVRKRV